MRGFLGIFVAVVLHAGVILFGGWFFLHDQPEDQAAKRTEVELLSKDKEKEKEKPKEEPKEKPEEIDKEKPPDAAEEAEKLNQMVRLDQPVNDAPALDAVSLDAISAKLNGLGGSGDFGFGVDLKGGGRIGGTGTFGSQEEKIEDAFNLNEIDQKPRVIYQATPVYPAEMRGKKVEGVVSVVFVVDPAGRVTNQRSEKSSNVVFEKPALEAVRQWKFEPGTKAGKPVACKIRVSIRFERS